MLVFLTDILTYGTGKKVEDNKKMIVVKHNDLIDAAQRLSVIESRILLTCIAQVNSMAVLDSNMKFVVSASEIAESSGIDTNGAYDKIKEAVVRLYQREVIFLRPSKRVTESRVRWVFQIDYIPNEGIIELSFSPPIVKLLSEITRDFTQYKLENVIGFKGQYSFRLYELFCRWGGKGKEIELDKLRDLMQMEHRYPVWQDFKKRVLDPSIVEINALHNTSASWSGIKRGRDIFKVKFIYEIDKPKKAVLCVEDKKPKIAKNRTVSEAKPVDNLQHYTDLRKRFGDKAPIPEDIKAEMKEKGLWQK